MMIKLNGVNYYAVYTFEPADNSFNASINFEGYCEKKYFFDPDYLPLDPKEADKLFLPNEILGSLEIIEADNENIDIYFYIYYPKFCEQIDCLLLETPKSWEIEVYIDPPIIHQIEVNQKSRKELIIEFYNKGLTYKQIAKELEKYNIYIVPKTVQNLVLDYKKELGENVFPLRIKKKPTI